jgi:hypothetical protein
LARVSPSAPRASHRNLVGCALVALGVAASGCSSAEVAPPPADPTQFGEARFASLLHALSELGARPAGSAALSRARVWVDANAPPTQADASVVLVASLTTHAAAGDALAEESSGAALVLEAARALAARGEPVGLAWVDGPLAPAPPLAESELAVYVKRGCSVPRQRDLLSHRVLRERFFRAAGPAAGAPMFGQIDAPHAALLAAGAKRVVALDGPRAPDGACEGSAFGDALLRFVTDVTELLARGRANAAAPPASP